MIILKQEMTFILLGKVWKSLVMNGIISLTNIGYYEFYIWKIKVNTLIEPIQIKQG